MEAKEFRKLPAQSTRLAKLKDPAAIPLMIAAIEAEDSYPTIFGLGNFGLGTMTGVTYDDSHGSDFWLKWWKTNKAKYPAAVRDAPFQKFKGFAERVAPVVPTLQASILKFCASQMGLKVGSGQCTDLAMEALSATKSVGMKEQEGRYCWGELIYRREVVNGQTREYPDPQAKLKIVPGDIVQYNLARFEWSTPEGFHSIVNFGGPIHTNVLLEVSEKGYHWKTYDQNMNNHQYVENFEVDLKGMKSGSLEVFAPIAK